jgi:magnesium transporter
MLTVLVRGAGQHFSVAAPADLPQLLTTPDQLVWVDLSAPTPQEVAVLTAVFHFHPLTIEDCLNRFVDPPKVDDYGDYLFVVSQGIVFSALRETVVTTELDLYIGRSYVVSFHQQPLAAVTEVRSRCERAALLPARGPDWLAQALLDALVDQLLPVVEQLDDELAHLEDEALANHHTQLVERLTTLKRSTLRLHRLIAPQRDVINRCARGDFPHLVRSETFMYYRDIYDHLVRLEGMLDGLRDVGDSVMATYLATLNNRMNEVMKALSVVGTILLPLTLIASIFGTNFGPTYFAWGWPGFIGMCVVMVLGAALGTAWFRQRGWF